MMPQDAIIKAMKIDAMNCNKRMRSIWGASSWENNPGAAADKIMNALREQGPMTSRQLQEFVDCSQQCVSNRIQRLKKAGKIKEHKKVMVGKSRVCVWRLVKTEKGANQ